jgi:hypothetical protein
MADRKIDYDRGVLINTHPTLGFDVYMYVDDPGKYLTVHGKAIPKEIAKAAGYDVDRFEKERIRKERRDQALEQIDKDLLEAADVQESEEKELNGWKLINIGMGRYHVADPDGNKVTPQPITQEQGLKLLSQMAVAG